jgi:hypothetical protein
MGILIGNGNVMGSSHAGPALLKVFWASLLGVALGDTLEGTLGGTLEGTLGVALGVTAAGRS